MNILGTALDDSLSKLGCCWSLVAVSTSMYTQRRFSAFSSHFRFASWFHNWQSWDGETWLLKGARCEPAQAGRHTTENKIFNKSGKTACLGIWNIPSCIPSILGILRVKLYQLNSFFIVNVAVQKGLHGFEEKTQPHVLECFGLSFQIAGKYKGKIEQFCKIILDVLEEVIPTFF